MILRIVRMEFTEETIDQFERLFSTYQSDIRHFPGCQALELHGDPGNELVRYTHSRWESTEALEAYRHSDIFSIVWPQTKVLFGAKPLAYSLSLIKAIP